MVRRSLLILCLTLISVIAVSSPALAEKPIQLALFPPIQLVSEGESITGLRLSIYGKNAALTGIDIGFINHLTAPSVGLQWGAVGYCESNFTGIQDNFINVTKGTFLGLQGGAYNYVGSGTGLQYGFINYAKSWEGLQLGFINYAGTISGLQIGLINFIGTGGFMPVFPIVNWTF
ncbi:MAG: hypothetical protein HN356_10935 [Calditrichaeota bacterium]|jgi:hypothetical protein|nr:hypothetical protein [Calditrichota bacterium]MBT7788577.1 hypothetical protein [Calditrichota bacterium]